VLVQNRLADPGPLRDLVHRRRVVAARHENLRGGVEQLPSAREAREAGSPGAGGRSGGHRVLRVETIVLTIVLVVIARAPDLLGGIRLVDLEGDLGQFFLVAFRDFAGLLSGVFVWRFYAWLAHWTSSLALVGRVRGRTVFAGSLASSLTAHLRQPVELPFAAFPFWQQPRLAGDLP
jgi:hypothetical protein